MGKKSLLASAVCAVAVTGAGASAAFAGEVNGKGQPTAAPAHTNSICAFSGKNDNPVSTNPEDPGGIVQSYGFSFVSQGLKAVVPSPRVGCNGHSGFLAGGGE
jgi:hypothetical protein